MMDNKSKFYVSLRGKHLSKSLQVPRQVAFYAFSNPLEGMYSAIWEYKPTLWEKLFKKRPILDGFCIHIGDTIYSCDFDNYSLVKPLPRDTIKVKPWLEL